MGFLEYLGGVAKVIGGSAGAAFFWILAAGARLANFPIIATVAAVIGLIPFLYAVYSRHELDRQTAAR